MLATAQQLYTGEKKIRIAGDLITNPEGFLVVTPDLISGDFQYLPADGTLPLDRFAMVTMWTQLLAQMRNFQQVMMGYDMGKIFEWVAQLGGAKNIRQFKLVPGDQDALAADTNLMALPGGGGGGRSGSGPGAAGQSRGPLGPRADERFTGLGNTG
jgi:hypothetical protein